MQTRSALSASHAASSQKHEDALRKVHHPLRESPRADRACLSQEVGGCWSR